MVMRQLLESCTTVSGTFFQATDINSAKACDTQALCTNPSFTDLRVGSTFPFGVCETFCWLVTETELQSFLQYKYLLHYVEFIPALVSVRVFTKAFLCSVNHTIFLKTLLRQLNRTHQQSTDLDGSLTQPATTKLQRLLD